MVPRTRRWWTVVAALVLVLAATATAAGATDLAPRAAPVVGADFRISGTGALGEEGDAAVASSGTEYLIVWADDRNQGARGWDIYARRVAADGSHLGDDFLVSDAPGLTNEETPAVAWNGTEYLVVWSDHRKPARSEDIYGQRVSAEGIQQGANFRICGTGAVASDQVPAVAWDGTGYLVVWEDGRDDDERGTDVYGRRVTAAGMPTGPDFRISGTSATDDEHAPAVAWDGTGYLVVWEDSRDSNERGTDVRGRRVAAGGGAEGRDFRISGSKATGDDKSPAVASDGTGYLVVWEDWRMLPDRRTDIYGRLVSAAGALVGDNFRICGAGATMWDWVPAVAWDGAASQYLVVWQDERDYGDRGADIRGRRVAPDGTHAGADFRISGLGATTYEYSPALVWGGGESLVVWQDSRQVGTRGRDIWGRRVDL
jgi:hypothetical protein